MDLKQFIKQAITDISEAVVECQNEIKNGTTINPLMRFTNIDMSRDSIYTLNFDVAVTASSENNNGKRVGASIKVVEAAFGKDATIAKSAATRITFCVPISFPIQTTPK